MSKRTTTKIEITERVHRVRRECRVEETTESASKENVPGDENLPKVTLVRNAQVTPQRCEKPRVRAFPLPLRPKNEDLPERTASLAGSGKRPKVIRAALAKSMSTPELNSVYRIAGQMNDLKNDLSKDNRRDLARARLRSSPRLNAEVTRKSLKRGLNFDHERKIFDENRLVPLDFDEDKLLEKLTKRKSDDEEQSRKRRKLTAKPDEASFSVPAKYLEKSSHDLDH